MYTDTLTVTGVNAAPPQMAPATMNATPAPAMLQVTVRSSGTGMTFSFTDVASNAALYTFGASLSLTIAPAAAKAAS